MELHLRGPRRVDAGRASRADGGWARLSGVGLQPASSRPAELARPGALVAPLVGLHHVTRDRVDLLLDEAAEARLVLVSAPAGSGKSTALSGWLQRRHGTSGWYSLESDDNDPVVFWPSLGAVLDLPEPTTFRGPRDVASALVTRGERGSPPLVLVLDDYHAITNDAIHSGIDRLVVGAPASLRLVISTRHDPPLMLAKLRAQGNLRELRYHELRLDD